MNVTLFRFVSPLSPYHPPPWLTAALLTKVTDTRVGLVPLPPDHIPPPSIAELFRKTAFRTVGLP
jgi:hypothetical protein